MNKVNRTALSIKPKEPYLDWANFAMTSYEGVEEMRATSKIILLPEPFYNHQDDFLKENYRELFELELEAWVPDRKFWPQQTDLDMFKRWFDVELYALILDFNDDDLSKESYWGLGRL